MWSTLDRTRRRLLRVGAAPSDTTDLDDASPLFDADEPVSQVVLAIGRAEFDRLGAVLQVQLGPGTQRPDTPARLESALTVAIARWGGVGQARVNRRPAGLYTPEAWQIRLDGIDHDTVDTIRRAIRGGIRSA